MSIESRRWAEVSSKLMATFSLSDDTVMDINFFAQPSDVTTLDFAHQALLEEPDSISDLCQRVQGKLIHAYWLEHYGVVVDDVKRFSEMQLRSANDILNHAANKSALPCNIASSPHDRVISICRDFSLVLCAILRAKGIPARLRSGFATYLVPDKYEDHWVCEYWDKENLCWRLADAQLDEIHRQILKYEFDPSNVPSSEFILAGKAWQLCRSQELDSNKFGFAQFTGLEFIKGSIIRDLFALSKYEMHTWDTGWGIVEKYLTPIVDQNEVTLLDELALISANSHYEEAIERVCICESIRLPDGWNYSMFPTLSELYTMNSNEK